MVSIFLIFSAITLLLLILICIRLSIAIKLDKEITEERKRKADLEWEKICKDIPGIALVTRWIT